MVPSHVSVEIAAGVTLDHSEHELVLPGDVLGRILTDMSLEYMAVVSVMMTDGRN